MVRNILFIVLIFFSSTLYASIAKVMAFSGEVFVIRDSKEIKISLDSKIEEKDEIKTLNNSKVQILFEDNTVITIGKNSNFSIEKFLFDNSNEPEIKVNITTGVFRVITGKIGKIAPKRFNIKTKTSSIGIRGTQIVLDITPSLETIYCTEGIIEIASLKTDDLKVIEQGKLVKVNTLTNTREEKDIPTDALKEIDSDTTFSTDSKKVEIKESVIETKVENTELKTNEALNEIEDEVSNKVESQIDDSLNEFINDKPNILMATVNNSSESDFRSVDNATYDLSNSTNEDVTISVSTSEAIYTILLDEFETKIDDTNTNNNNASLVSMTTPNIPNAYFSAFYNQQYDDISNSQASFNSEDSVSWGKWDVYSYSEDSTQETNSVSNTGYWIQGELTNSSVIKAYINAGDLINRDVIANYQGYILASDELSNNYDVTNTSNDIAVNFSNQTLSGTMNFNGNTTYSYDVNGTISSSGFAITEISNNSNATISSKGNFYGNIGQTIAGDLYINDTTSEKTFSGVFISRSTDLETTKNQIDSAKNGISSLLD